MRWYFHSAIVWILLLASVGVCETYSFKPAVSRRQVNVSRAYDLALVPGKKNVVFLPAMMSFYGATNVQEIVNVDFKYSVAPDEIKVIADELGMPRKYYRLTWNAAQSTAVRVEETMTVKMLCRNKLCTKASYPYSPEVLEPFKTYLVNDKDSDINVNNKKLEPICKAVRKQNPTAEEAVELVCDWVNDNIVREKGKGIPSDEVLEKRKANSFGICHLACAILRKLQIPCDIVWCRYLGGDSGFCIIEVYFPDAGWIFYDVAWRERGFKSLDCMMTSGHSYRTYTPHNKKHEWIKGYFSDEQGVGNYVKPTAVRTKAIRPTPKKSTLGVRVAPINAPKSIKIRKRPLRDLMLDASVLPGVREYSP